MKARVMSAARFACLCFLSLARQTRATTTSLASHPSINKKAEERGVCYAGTPGSATERSFFVSGRFRFHVQNGGRHVLLPDILTYRYILEHDVGVG